MKRLMQIRNPFLTTFLVMLFSFLGSSVFSQEKGDNPYIKTTEKGVTYELVGWETKVVYNPYMFTWTTWEEPILEKNKIEKTTMVRVSEFDRPPIFDRSCLTVDDQFACSNEKLQAYLEGQTSMYPESAKLLDQEGLEYVTFSIDSNGKFDGNIKVVSKEKPCYGCADAAAEIVAGMEDMVPSD
jgi:hypothetical protein